MIADGPAGAVLRHQPGPDVGGDGPPLRAARQPLLAGAARLGLHARGCCAPAEQGELLRTGWASPTSWPGRRARADELTRRGAARGRPAARGEGASGCAPAWLAVRRGDRLPRGLRRPARRGSGRRSGRSAAPGSGCCPTPAASTPTGRPRRWPRSSAGCARRPPPGDGARPAEPGRAGRRGRGSGTDGAGKGTAHGTGHGRHRWQRGASARRSHGVSRGGPRRRDRLRAGARGRGETARAVRAAGARCVAVRADTSSRRTSTGCSTPSRAARPDHRPGQQRRGHRPLGRFTETPVEVMRRVVDVNVTGRAAVRAARGAGDVHAGTAARAAPSSTSPRAAPRSAAPASTCTTRRARRRWTR